MPEDFDNIEDFEAKDTAHKLPIGWLVLFVGLIVWGVLYVFLYLPQISGWTQGSAYEQSLEKK